MNKKITIILIGLFAVFFIVRLPGVSLPYHQDEWKNIAALSSVENAGKFYAHPPLMQMIFIGAYQIFGPDNFRFVPLMFALTSAVLLYVVAKHRLGKSAALWSVAVYSIIFYGILGAIVPDVDGAILPFFFLLAVYFYDTWSAASTEKKWKWLILLGVVLLIGFLTKLSFIIAIGAIGLDYIVNNWRFLKLKKISYGVLSIIGFAAAYTGLLYFIHFIYPAFDMKIMFGHAGQFSEGTGRNWIQIAVQGTKVVFYLSPLAFVPLIFISKDIFKKTLIFSLYIFTGLIFYFVLFDFSRGALDKYLMFVIVPLSVIIGGIFSEIFSTKSAEQTSSSRISSLKIPYIIALVLSAILICVNFLPHEVLPLYPKSLWFKRVLAGDWIILNPFNGGSGPIGFYVSFLFIALSFILSIVVGAIGFWKKRSRKAVVVFLVIVGISYNAVFAEELFFGKINGSAPVALKESIKFIESRPDIKRVITYNDTGAGYLEKTGRYAGRIYATPASEEGYKALFAKHIAADGHFLVVGIPPLGPATFYGKFFADCDSLFETTSGQIRADVYRCDKK